MSVLGGSSPSLQLGSVTVGAGRHVRVLGVRLSSDLGLDRRVSGVGAACFCRLRRFGRVRRSLGAVSAAALVRAFVTSRVGYCNATAVLAAAPGAAADGLWRVLNAAARVVSDTKKFDQGLSRVMHQELHELGVLTHRCQ